MRLVWFGGDAETWSVNPRLHHPVRTAFRRRDGALDLMDMLGFEAVIAGVGGSDLAAQS